MKYYQMNFIITMSLWKWMKKLFQDDISYICTINSKINGTPKGVYLPIITLVMLLWTSKFATAKIESKYLRNGQVNTFGGTIYFAVNGTVYI